MSEGTFAGAYWEEIALANIPHSNRHVYSAPKATIIETKQNETNTSYMICTIAYIVVVVSCVIVMLIDISIYKY